MTASMQSRLADLVARDANEGDTRLLVTDFLCDGLGFDKYADLTTEYQVKREFADYGLRIDRELVAFIEVKRVATKLSTRHLRQVEMYAVNEGVEWIISTNGAVWQVYHITGGLPVVIDLALESISGDQVELVRQYLALPDADRSGLRIPLDRLNSAKLHLHSGHVADSVLDLGIALEALLCSDDDPIELSYRFRVRGALLRDGDLAMRKDTSAVLKALYLLRSKVAHGKAVTRVRVSRFPWWLGS